MPTLTDVHEWLSLLQGTDEAKLDAVKDLRSHFGKDHTSPDDQTIIIHALRVLQARLKPQAERLPSHCYACGLLAHVGLSCDDAMDLEEAHMNGMKALETL